MIDLSIIIISYNTKDLLINCLQSIIEKSSDKLRYEVIVVDNGSKDRTREEIAKLKLPITRFKWIQNKENLGFAKANNIGIKEAKGEYLLFLNSDTQIISKNTLEEMLVFMENHPQAGAVTCKVELADGTNDDASHRGFPTPWNAFCHFSGLGKIFPRSSLFNGYHKGWKSLNKVHEIDALAGAFMFLRRKAGQEVEWWDEDYFFYGEDLDLCFKLKANNWKIYYVPTVKILHFKGVSSGIKKHSQHLTSADYNLKKQIQKARFDAMRIFYKKHYKNKYPFFVTELVLYGIKIKQFIVSVL